MPIPRERLDHLRAELLRVFGAEAFDAAAFAQITWEMRTVMDLMGVPHPRPGAQGSPMGDWTPEKQAVVRARMSTAQKARHAWRHCFTSPRPSGIVALDLTAGSASLGETSARSSRHPADPEGGVDGISGVEEHPPEPRPTEAK